MSKKKKKAPARPPRRFTPKTSKRITGWLMVFGILIAVAAINRQSTLLLVAVAEWLVSLCFMLYYWRCPECGKSLPKTGKIDQCPQCGAKID